MVISAFFDESGKFKDQSTVSFAGVAGIPADFDQLHRDWQRHLHLNGLKVLTMKQALNVRVPLSRKRKAMGVIRTA